MKTDSNSFALDKQAVASALQKMGIEAENEKLDKLEQFIQLLLKWNKVYNLTALREPEQMVSHHLLDSLAVLPYLSGSKILDVGSGAGLPGIPLALFKPELSFTLLDSNRKKTRFIAQAAIELGLKNVEVATGRVEKHHFDQSFDLIVTRAFAAVDKILAFTCTHCAEDGKWLLMKGVVPKEELAELPEGFSVDEIIPLNVPGLIGDRHAIIIARLKN